MIDTNSPYPIGSKIAFKDATATRSRGAAIGRGTVNGESLRDETGRVVYVPAFCKRDAGREPTTVYVKVSNILSVTPREDRPTLPPSRGRRR